MHLLLLRHQRQQGIGQEQVLQVVVDVVRLRPRWLAGHLVAVDDQRQILPAVPGMQQKALHPGLLDRLAHRRLEEARRRFVVAAGLQPAADDHMVDQQHLQMVGREDDRAGGDVPGQRRPVVERVPLGHLPAQQRQMLPRRRDLGAIAGHDGFEAGEERLRHPPYFPIVDGHVPCWSGPRPGISKPWAPKKSRCPWIKLAVPRACR